MKYDFTFYNPTKIYFGKTAFKNLKTELKKYGPNILFMYGKGSIKRSGLYDKIMDALNACHKNVTILEGVMPNPTYAKVLEGAKLVRDNHIDLILAVGGGSVIDCAKGISAASYAKEDPWERYYIRGEKINTKLVPIGSILTMVGTGSEMNGGSVITNEEKKLKKGHVYESANYPKFSILNPELTFTVPVYQMKSGIFDIFSHLMEQYFSGDDDNVSDYLIEGLMRSLIHSSKEAIKNPKNYEARSNIMWCATMALNTLVKESKTEDWQVHSIEHQLGAYTDCAHGMGLAAISIPYYKLIYKYGLKKFARFATNVWGISPADKSDNELALLGIEALKNYIKECGMVTSIKELGATEEMLPLIANSVDLGGGYHNLTREEVLEILKECF